MQRADVMHLIKKLEPSIRALGASSVYLFGSTARDEASESSDVDILVDRAAPERLGFPEFFELEELLETALGVDIDLVTREALHPVLKAEIEQTAIRVL
ncbi:MAG: nucleotidyltransferase domain-containing protein [Hyphomicrobiaceae bacterium]|nr:nucleotidyltransferase domain-containing protein [Hyphomicrobiaceae bacterium]